MLSAVCPACGGSRWRLAIRLRVARIERCARCGLGRTVPPPAEANGRERFADDAAYFAAALAAPKSAAWRRFRDAPLALLAAHGAHPGQRLLDLGCNVGYLVHAASERGYHARGVDGSAAAVASGRRKLGVDLECARLENAPVVAGGADIVVVNHVLEHVADPAAVLATARKALGPAGLLLVGVPNFGSPIARLAAARWAGLVPDQHRWHFTARALRRVVDAAGFVVLGSRTCMLLHEPVTVVGRAKWVLRRALEPLGLADNLLVVARRR